MTSNLCQPILHIETSSGEIFQLPQIQIGDTIAEVKKLIYELKHVHPNDQKLWVLEFPLDDDYILKDLDEVLELETRIHVDVYTWFMEKPLTIELESNQQIREAKHIIAAEIGLPADHQELIYDDVALNDENYLLNYGIKNGAVLNLVYRDDAV